MLRYLSFSHKQASKLKHYLLVLKMNIVRCGIIIPGGSECAEFTRQISDKSELVLVG